MFWNSRSDYVKEIIKKKYLSLRYGSSTNNTIHNIFDDIGTTLAISTDFMKQGYFLPGGRILASCGIENKNISIANCNCIELQEDSIEGILLSCYQIARTASWGQGIGIDISKLRPKNDHVNNSASKSSGSVSFMELFNALGKIIGSENRRMAMLIMIDISHPDILDFVSVKRNLSKITNANISVKVSNKFIETLLVKGDFDLIYKGKVYQTIKAESIWREIIKSNWIGGEPGLIFWDRMVSRSTNTFFGNSVPIAGCNACSEAVLSNGGLCILGSLNLYQIYKDNPQTFIKSVEDVTNFAIRFLDRCVDYELQLINYRLSKLSTNSLLAKLQEDLLKLQQQTLENTRKIGLGTFGLADILAYNHIKYDSNESIQYIDDLYSLISKTAKLTSIDLAMETNSFPLFQNLPQQQKEQYLKQYLHTDTIPNLSIRNINVLSQAPTGTLSSICETSSGIEPVYSLKYTRRNPSLNQEYTVSHRPYYEAPQSVKDSYVVSHDCNANTRLKIISTLSKHIDQNISYTINLKENTSTQDIDNIYRLANVYEVGSITIYRDKSRNNILSTPTQNKLKSRPTITTGKTIKITTSCGNLFLTLNKDSDNEYIECFVRLGKGGTCLQSFTEAIGRLISLNLQNRAKLTEVIGHLKAIKCINPAFNPSGKVESCSDAIAKGLEKLSNEQVEVKKSDIVAGGGICPDCSSQLIYEGSCCSCPNCGYSRCS